MREMGSLLVQVLVIAECLRSVAAVRLHQRACGGDARVVLPPPPCDVSVVVREAWRISKHRLSLHSLSLKPALDTGFPNPFKGRSARTSAMASWRVIGRGCTRCSWTEANFTMAVFRGALNVRVDVGGSPRCNTLHHTGHVSAPCQLQEDTTRLPTRRMAPAFGRRNTTQRPRAPDAVSWPPRRHPGGRTRGPPPPAPPIRTTQAPAGACVESGD